MKAKLIFLFVMLLMSASHLSAAVLDQWRPVGSGREVGLGIQGQVVASAVWDDGSGPALYVGGNFQSTANGQRLNNIARWNGQDWVPLGTGLNGTVGAMRVYQGKLIVGGIFTSASGLAVNNLAAWDGANWTALGAGTDSAVLGFGEFGSLLVVMGRFTTAGGLNSGSAALWNGLTWNTFGAAAAPTSELYTSVMYNGELLVGGSGALLRWTGNGWQAFNGTASPLLNVYSLFVQGEDLIAGGGTAGIGGSPGQRVFRFRGGAWTALGTTTGNVYATSEYQGALHIAGNFSQANGVNVNGIARWDGAGWVRIQDIPVVSNYEIRTLSQLDNALYVGGFFFRVGPKETNLVGRWDGSNWQGMGVAPDFPVRFVMPWNNELAVFGDFSHFGDARGSAASWNGSRWAGFGDGPGFSVTNAIEYQGALIVTGGRTQMARWDGATWTRLTAQTEQDSGGTAALAIYNNEVVIAGQFNRFNGVLCNGLAAWNGTSFRAFEGNQAGVAFRSLKTVGNLLYVGGTFTSISGVLAPGIAVWNGSNYQALGAGLSGWVNDLNFFNGDLHAAGIFGNSGATLTQGVARFSAGAWQSLGAGLQLFNQNGQINVILPFRNELVATGSFSRSGTAALQTVSSWNGSRWQSLGMTTFTASPNATFGAAGLTQFGDDLVAAGTFDEVSGQKAFWLASFGPTDQTTTTVVSATPVNPSTGQAVTYTVEIRGELAPTAGQLTITGNPSGSCTDISITPISATTSVATCSIVYRRAGSQGVRARFSGGTGGNYSWSASTSAASFGLAVTPDEFFCDGFESPERCAR
jgi:hypothetical protein